MRKLRTLRLFVKWALPGDGRSLWLYAHLLRVLLHGRQSVYAHFKLAKAGSTRARLKSFINSLASVQTPVNAARPATVPARLLARLLRTIYLTEVLPRRDPAARRAGPNRGYAAHPRFSYGESLRDSTRARTRDGHLG
jgi:hypothetical protein